MKVVFLISCMGSLCHSREFINSSPLQHIHYSLYNTQHTYIYCHCTNFGLMDRRISDATISTTIILNNGNGFIFSSAPYLYVWEYFSKYLKTELELFIRFLFIWLHRWIPLARDSDAKLWCFLWAAPEQTAEQTIETPVIWDRYSTLKFLISAILHMMILVS